MRVCTDYDQAHTHYLSRDAKKWKAYCAKATDNPTTKKPSRPHFFIYWLRPLIPLETADYRALCTQVSKPEGDRAQQRTWFGRSKNKESAIRTVVYKAERVRRHYTVRNALRWLEVRANPIAILWDDFRCLPIGGALSGCQHCQLFC